jgi:hypothetical protein
MTDAEYLAELRSIRSDLESSQGLSIAHISTLGGPIAAALLPLGGNVCRIWAASAAEGKPDPCLIRVPLEGAEARGTILARCDDGEVWIKVRRGGVSSFSRQSRTRLMMRINSIDRRTSANMPAMITLTYPGEFSADPEEWKRHLANFKERFFREYGKVPAFWKLEFQERGAPHFHLLIYDPLLRMHQWSFKKWLSKAWYETVASGDERHLKAGTNVELPRASNKPETYCSKYVGKPEAGRAGVGRFWGLWWKELLPVDLIQVAIDLHQFYVIRRCIRRMLKGVASRHGRWMFLPPRESLRLLLYALGDTT